MVDVQGQPIDGGETMAERHRRLDEELVQGALLDDPAFLRQIVEGIIQHLLEAEITEHLGAAPHQRTENRKGHRNGYKARKLKSRVGTLELLVPQEREGTFSTQLFSRYQRNEKALTLALMEMYVEGVSTRKVKEVTEELCGTSFSKSTVSRLATELDSELEEWRSRPLTAEAYPYLFVDARYEKVRVGCRIVNEGVLVVSALRDDGYREILGVEVADVESEATYQELFRVLKERGLKGVELVTSDEHKGLKREQVISAASSTTRRTSWGWWASTNARNSPRACEGSSPLPAGSWLCALPRSWRTGGEGATKRWPSTSRSTSRSASLAWLSPSPTGGASALPTVLRGSTRR
jgi:transposase-like protein